MFFNNQELTARSPPAGTKVEELGYKNEGKNNDLGTRAGHQTRVENMLG